MIEKGYPFPVIRKFSYIYSYNSNSDYTPPTILSGSSNKENELMHKKTPPLAFKSGVSSKEAV